MCGIIGYQSKTCKKNNVAKAICFVMNRGYDSFGIDINSEIKKKIYPTQDDVKEIVKSFDVKENQHCIAHTRWATHGNVTNSNAHPIQVGNVSVVMNGQIENYEELTLKYKNKLHTQCDTELIPLIVNDAILNFENLNNREITLNELKEEIEKLVKQFLGDFSFALKYKDSIILYKRGNPLHIGFSNNSIIFSSDYRACMIIGPSIEETYCLDDEEVIVLNNYHKENCIGLIESKIEDIQEKFFLNDLEDDSSIHQTLQEMLRQGNFNNMDLLKNKEFITYITPELDNLICLGEGSSYHAALHFEELYNKKRTKKDSTHTYKKVAFSSCEIEGFDISHFKNSSVLLYSQSGETKDLINVLKDYQFDKIFIITNNSFSTLARSSNHVFDMNCGIEHGVAATVSFTNTLFANEAIINKKSLEESLNPEVFELLKRNEDAFQKILSISEIDKVKTGFVLSKNINLFTLEACLKLSELSEILFMPNNFNSLKHGMYACIEENKTVVFLDSLASSSLIHQLLSRQAIVITINSPHQIDGTINLSTQLNENQTEFEELFLKIVLMQKIAFEVAIAKQLNPDKPKNLAKSVTVES